jgi:rhomboid family GlyGly-CTERM serine protease
MPMTLSQLRPHYLPLSLALCVTLIALGGSELSVLFRFNREAILHGQLWRLFSGHLVHLGWSHCWLNIAGLALIWALVGSVFTTRQWLIIIAGSALGISLGLIAFNPKLAWYVGLSGVLHGMLVAGAVTEIRRGRHSSYALLILVVAKLVWEQMLGPLPGSEASAGGTVIIDAHLYGGLCGLFFAGFFWVNAMRSTGLPK